MIDGSGVNQNKPLICFIDDSAEERELFQQVFGADDGAFRVICAETFDEAEAVLEKAEKIPSLFVLDLYFPGDDVQAEAVEPIGPITLPDDEGNLLKAFLNLETVQDRYRQIRAADGQSPAGGLKLIEKVQATFPGIPIVSYTRKGTVEEAEKARQTGARRVLQKPSGSHWDDTRDLTGYRKVEMENAFRRAMTQDPYELLNLIVHYTSRLASPEDLARIALEVVDLRRKLQSQSDSAILSRDVDRLMDCTSHPFIRALIYQLQA